MKPIRNWKDVVTRAWSIRLIILAGLLSGLEVALPYFGDFIAPGRFALLSVAVTAGAFVARLTAQKDLEDE